MKALSDKANRSYSDLTLNLCVWVCAGVCESTHAHTHTVVYSTLFLCPAPGTPHKQTGSQLLPWPSSLATLTSWRPGIPLNRHRSSPVTCKTHTRTHTHQKDTCHSGKQETICINKVVSLVNWRPHTSLAHKHRCNVLQAKVKDTLTTPHTHTRHTISTPSHQIISWNYLSISEMLGTPLIEELVVEFPTTEQQEKAVEGENGAEQSRRQRS